MAAIFVLKGDAVAVEAQYGADALSAEIPLAECSFLSAVLASGERGLILVDARAEDPHKMCRLVTGPLAVRFFAGVPLRTTDGGVAGMLAAFDRDARTIAPESLTALLELGEVAQELLETSRQSQLLRRAVDRAGDCISIHEIPADGEWPGRTLFVNDHTVARTGFTRDEIFQRSIVSGPDTDRAALRGVLRDVSKGVARQLELPVPCKDGSHFWSEIHFRPLPDDDGAVRRYMTICRDISGRREAERTIQLLSRAINEALDFVVVTDFTPPSKGGPYIEYVSPPLLKATGYRSTDLTGKPFSMLFAAENDGVILDAIAGNIEQGRDVEKEVLIRRKDGSTFWVEYTGRPLRQPNGQLSHWVAVGRDISVRRQTHEQMAALIAAIDAVDRHVEIYSMENGRYTLAFQNAAVNDDTSEFVGTLLNEADIPGDTPLREELRAGKNVIVTPDGLEIRPLDSQARTIMCIKQRAV